MSKVAASKNIVVRSNVCLILRLLLSAICASSQDSDETVLLFKLIRAITNQKSS